MANTSLRRARLVVAYDGSTFHGFAKNPEVPTVEGMLTEALEKITQTDIHLVAAGRTDAGVHARGQVVSLDVPARIKIESLPKKLNALCGPRIAVREAAWAAASFHARFSAIWRHYRYTVLNTLTPDPFVATTAWHVHQPLDVRPMQLACDAVMGERDFSAFCRKPASSASAIATSLNEDDEAPVSMKRYVMKATWKRTGDLVEFEVRANAFCHQMVRSLVGTFVDIGLGRRSASDMMSLIRSGRRQDASQIAPAHGLCLWEVGYPTSVD
ncbi:MAG: tRNA pseudouridine(38-40) synthase TruA [Actinobacteria bacterium]|nr:tRNA pseudouridine(38-40) synthase TruA [Actinomycetota bacterium]